MSENMLGGYLSMLPWPYSHFHSANANMLLTPQEQDLYLRHLSNLWGAGGVDNPDGSRSSLSQMGIGIDGRTYNLPTVYEGRHLSPEDAIARAHTQGFGLFPSYSSEDEAERRYQQMHDYMAQDTADYLRAMWRRP